MKQVSHYSRRKAAIWLVALLAVFSAAALRAERTRYWRQSTFDEFERGTAKGVALRSDGKLLLAPRFAPVGDPNTAYLWAIRADSKGNLFAAGGSGAKVIRLDASGKSSVFFESAELSAQALAMDAQDNLYVGTSPDGKIYKVSHTGEKKIFFEPKTKYIWAISVDTDGTVYVATGDTGMIYAVTPDGRGDVFYKSDQAHIRALAFDRQGNLLAGTEPDGRILRISKSGAAGKARQGFVLYETSRKEITSMIVDAAGNLYAAAIGDKSRTSGPGFIPSADNPPQGQPITGTQAPGGANINFGGQGQQPPQTAPFVPLAAGGGSAVYRLAPDGSPQQVWSSRDSLVYSLGFSPSGKLLLGTGNRGTVIQLDGDNLFTSLAKTESGQVTGLTQGAGGKVFLCTANPGKVFSMGPEDMSEGTFESQPMDARIFSTWGRLEWWGENSGETSAGRPHVEVFIRTGNTSNPDSNWSSWAGPYSKSGQKVEAPSARFAQWRAVLRSGSPSPVVSWVSLSYMPKNLPPQVDGIAIQDPGVRVLGIPGTGGTGPSIPVRLKQPDVPGATSAPLFGAPAQGDRQTSRFDPPAQGGMQKGYQSVLWTAHDDNDDELTYRVYYRGEGEKEWKLLKENVREKYFSWDTSSLPDGAYYLKIVVSDAPSNPPAEFLEGSRESDRFVVDNAPPDLSGLEAVAGESATQALIRFMARDSASAIARAEFSLDAGDWTLVYPAGRLSDSLEERYEISLAKLSPGEHTIAVRVYDRFENVSAAKLTFRAPIAAR